MASSDRRLSAAQELDRRRPRSFTEVAAHGALQHPSRTSSRTDVPLLRPTSATPVDNMYQQLHLALASGPVPIRIPETMLVSEEGQHVLLYTDDRGCVQLSAESNPLCHFLSICSAKTWSRGSSKFPLFIFRTANTPSRLLFSPTEAEKVWNFSLDHTKLLQRFIPPRCREPCITRVIWSSTALTKRFLIKKRGTDTTLDHSRLGRPRLSGTLKTGCMYASRLKRESFSPYLPCKSVMEERRDAPTTSEPVTPRSMGSFTVSAKAEGEYDWEEIPTQLVQAERFLTTVKDVVCKFLVRKNEVLHEIAYDAMQDAEDQYYFLNVKWARYNTTDEERQRRLTQGKKSATDLRVMFSSLMATKVRDDIPFIDMHEIQAQNVKMYMNHFSSLACPHSSYLPQPPKPVIKPELDHANTQLDSLAQSASILKQRDEESHRVRLESYHNENLLDSVITRAYSKVAVDSTLGHFFANMSKRELNMLKLGFSKAFSGVDNYYFKRTVKKAHEGLGIDRNQFDKFVLMFEEAMREEGVRSSDIETVSRHLNRFSGEVIEDDI